MSDKSLQSTSQKHLQSKRKATSLWNAREAALGDRQIVEAYGHALIEHQKEIVKNFLIKKGKDESYFTQELLSTRYPLSDLLIEKYKDKWYWPFYNLRAGILANRAIKWTEKLMRIFEGRRDWNYWYMDFSTPFRFPNAHEILNLDESEILDFYFCDGDMDEHEIGELSNDRAYLPWTEALIEKFEDKWSWDTLSRNSHIPWTESLIEKFEHKWNWKFNGLSTNKSLPWTVGLIEKYNDKWNYDNFIYYNLSVYEKVFMPYLDDELVDEIMSEIDDEEN